MNTMNVQKYYDKLNVVLNVVIKWDTLYYQFLQFKKKFENYKKWSLNDDGTTPLPKNGETNEIC